VKHSNPLAGLFLTLFLALSLVACGGASTPQPDPTDKTAPTLSFSLPSTGASAVPINAKLGFVFSETMDEASLELTSNPAITLGTATWNADSTSIAFDNGNLAASTAYTLTIKAKDASGNALGATTLTFTTSDSADTAAPSTPTGLVATPANGQVTLTWQANAEADVVGYTLYVGTAQDKLESKEFVTTNSTTVTGLTNGTTYFFAVDAVDAANNHSEQTAPVSATPSTTVTDTTPPTIQSSNPADNATDVTGEVVFSIVFSEPMDKSSLSFTLEPPDYVLELIAWSDNDTVLSLSPPQLHLFEQKENTPYKLTISAKDKAGNALSGDKEINFTTGFEVPRLVSSTPANGATNVGVEPFEIQLVFSKPMDLATLTASIKLEPENPVDYNEFLRLQLSDDATLLTISSILKTPLFPKNTVYTLSLTGKSIPGKALPDTKVTFKTVADLTAPRITSTIPLDDRTSLPLSPVVTQIVFDELMDEDSTIVAISSSPELPCRWQPGVGVDQVGKLISIFDCFSRTEELQPNTTYTVTVTTEAKDTSGNHLFVGVCLGDPGDPPCAYTFKFTTLIPPPTTGTLQINISGLPSGNRKVRVTGPGGFDSGFLDESTPFTGVPGDYTVTAQGFTTGQPGKPTCKIYTPEPATQTATVSAGQTATASVSYSLEPCPDLDP
jgi:Bacterial Ig-like domain/Fibronectin type III domain